MKYNFFKHNFKPKETLTAASLNRIEDNISNIIKSNAKLLIPIDVPIELSDTEISTITLNPYVIGGTTLNLGTFIGQNASKIVGLRIDSVDYISPVAKFTILEEGSTYTSYIIGDISTFIYSSFFGITTEEEMAEAKKEIRSMPEQDLRTEISTMKEEFSIEMDDDVFLFYILNESKSPFLGILTSVADTELVANNFSFQFVNLDETVIGEHTINFLILENPNENSNEIEIVNTSFNRFLVEGNIYEIKNFDLLIDPIFKLGLVGDCEQLIKVGHKYGLLTQQEFNAGEYYLYRIKLLDPPDMDHNILYFEAITESDDLAYISSHLKFVRYASE